MNPVKIFLKKKKMSLQFKYSFEKDEKVEFALTFPYTIKRLERFISKSQKKFDKIEGIQFNKEILMQSNLGRDIDILWLSEKNGSSIKLPLISNLFPNAANSTKIPFIEDRCHIVLSSRVHPAETASSFMMEGFINYFANNPKTTKRFLKKCTIGIVPMLNPDGVHLGNTRTDSKGVNLNSVYSRADLSTPSIYALKKLIRFLMKKSKINFFFDLHSHFTKRGVFLFGNPLKKKNYKKVLKFPVIFDEKESDFDLKNSGFGSEKDESTSRREIY